MSDRNDLVTIHDLELIKSTDKAGLYRDNDCRDFWIPWSQLGDGSVDRDGDSGDIYIPRWLADEKELDYEDEE